jgi:hypothetical protein
MVDSVLSQILYFHSIDNLPLLTKHTAESAAYSRSSTSIIFKEDANENIVSVRERVDNSQEGPL